MYIQKDANGNIVNMTQLPQIAEGSGWSEVADDAPEVLAFMNPIATLTPRQVRLVLNAAGLRAQVETAVAASDQNTKDMWQYATEFVRTDPVLVAMATQIGITSVQLDQLFINGSKL